MLLSREYFLQGYEAFDTLFSLLSPRASEQDKTIGIHIYIYVCGQKKLNRTLAIDSPFQTFEVGLFIEFIETNSTTALNRNTFLIE